VELLLTAQNNERVHTQLQVGKFGNAHDMLKAVAVVDIRISSEGLLECLVDYGAKI
jgi:hypothetical protein